MKLAYSALLVFLTILVFYIPMTSVSRVYSLRDQYLLDLAEKKAVNPQNIKNKQPYVIVSENKYNGNFEYSAVRIKKDSIFSDEFVIPVKNTDFEIKITSEGFLTHPQDGGFFLWYPRLGSKIKLFDRSGKFLWEKDESRYLQSFPDGKYIMAVAGDQSRVHFFHPDFTKITDIEGHLMIAYQLGGESDDGYNVCLGFLNGVVFFANLKNHIFKRFEIVKNMKALSCNLKDGNYIIQTEKKNVSENGSVVITDSIENYSIGSSESKKQFEFKMKKNYPETLPIAFNQKWGIAILPSENEPSLYTILAYDNSGNSLFEKNIQLQAETVQEMRILTFPYGFIIYGTHFLLSIDENASVVKRNLTEIRQVFKLENNAIVELPRYILALSLD